MRTHNLVSKLVLVTIFVVLVSVSVSAWIDCSPQTCIDGSSGSISCSEDKCTRTCQIQKCSENYEQVFLIEDSNSLPEWSDDDYEEEDAGSRYTPDSNQYCYKFEYQGSTATDNDDSECYDLATERGGKWGSDDDCDGEEIDAYGAMGFESDSGSNSWLRTISNIGDGAYGWTDDVYNSYWEYFWISKYDSDGAGTYDDGAYQWTSLDRGLCDEAGVARVYCAPNANICSSSSLINCGYGCYNDGTRPKAVIGIYRGIRDNIKDAFYDEWECDYMIEDNDLDYDGAWYKVSRAPLTSTPQNFMCYRQNEKPYMNWVYLNPKSPDINTDLYCTYSAGDPEGQTLTVEYNWYKNGFAQGINNKDLSSTYTSKGDNWKCSARVKDTSGAWSDWKTSGELTISGSKPQFTQNAYVEGAGATEGNPVTFKGSVTIKASISDQDGDSTKLKICDTAKCENTLCYTSFSTLAQKTCTFEVDPSSSTLLWYAFAEDSDGSTTGNSGVIHVNHKPSAGTPQISTSTEYHINSVIRCDAQNYQDSDGDQVKDSEYRWYRNGEALSGLDGTKNLNCGSIGCKVNDALKCSMQPVDQHGLKGDWTGLSNYIKIINTNPYFNAVPKSDSPVYWPKPEGAQVKFTAEIGDLERDTIRMFVCDDQGMKDSSGCKGITYCKTNYQPSGLFECLFNTAGANSSKYKWTMMVCDNRQGCYQYPNINSFYVNLQRPRDVKVYLNMELYKEYLGLLDSPVTVSGFENKLNTFLDDCEADELGYCYYPVTISSESQGKIKVYDVNIGYTISNDPPIMRHMQDIYVTEGELVKVIPYAYDPDDYPLIYTFSQPLDINGEWQTKNGDVGEYEATITVTDGVHVDSGTVKIIVLEDGLCLTNCSDYCDGAIFYTDGWCNFGTCQWDTVKENSTSCGYNPCDYMSCGSYCSGYTYYYNGACNIYGEQGVCNYEHENLSLNCCTPECNSDYDCDDGSSATTDYCLNPGTCNAECKYDSLCDVECTRDSDCNDNNAYTRDVCTRPGSCQSSCSHKSCSVYCSSNSDCNDGNSKTRDLCHNAGTCNSYCTNEGSSCDVLCASDLQCNDENSITTDICRNKGTCDSYCVNLKCSIECYYETDCDDGNSRTVDTCHNAGSCDSYCANDAKEALPDLVVQPIQKMIVSEEGTVVMIKITNEGAVDAKGVKWFINLDGDQNYSPSPVDIKKDQSIILYPVIPTQDSFTVSVVVDYLNEIKESNEDNNFREYPERVERPPGTSNWG